MTDSIGSSPPIKIHRKPVAGKDSAGAITSKKIFRLKFLDGRYADGRPGDAIFWVEKTTGTW